MRVFNAVVVVITFVVVVFFHVCNACHPEVRPRFLFVDASSWFAGAIKDSQRSRELVDSFVRLAASFCLSAVLSLKCLVYLYSEPSHN